MPHLSIDRGGISGQWDFYLGGNGNPVRGVIRARNGGWKTLLRWRGRAGVWNQNRNQRRIEIAIVPVLTLVSRRSFLALGAEWRPVTCETLLPRSWMLRFGD